MTAVKYREVYECAFKSRDKKSGKAVNNILHYRSGIQETTPPAYGGTISGAILETFRDNLAARWLTQIVPLLSVNYDNFTLTIKELVGWSVGGPINIVVNATNTTPILLATSGNHNLTSGTQILVAGALGNTAANGTWIVNAVGPQTLELVGSAGNGAYVGGGVWSRTFVPVHFVYGDSAESVTTSTGGVAGEALPLFASLSVKKSTSSAGRNWRGGIRLAPIAESVCLDGKFTTGQQTTNTENCLDFLEPGVENGGSASASRRMYPVVLSKTLAFLAATPFTESTSYSRDITSLLPSPNNGSVVRRKPKLSAAIA